MIRSSRPLEQRWPRSRRRGRPGALAEVVLRMLILRHLLDWSFDELEQEVRANYFWVKNTHQVVQVDYVDAADGHRAIKTLQVDARVGGLRRESK